jgi:hypothetical protein
LSACRSLISADLEVFARGALTQVSGKSPLARAIRYMLTRWEALTRYTTDGRLEMSNNAAERAIRPLTLGRHETTGIVFRRTRGGIIEGWGTDLNACRFALKDHLPAG